MKKLAHRAPFLGLCVLVGFLTWELFAHAIMLEQALATGFRIAEIAESRR